MKRLIDACRPTTPENYPHVCFIDYKAAYDTVDRDILHRKLRNKAIKIIVFHFEIDNQLAEIWYSNPEPKVS
jgi:hypothetical protein